MSDRSASLSSARSGGSDAFPHVSIFVAVTTLLVPAAFTTTYANGSAQSGSSGRFADYLTAGGTGQEQCATPTADRSGAWVCADQQPPSGSSGTEGGASPASGTYCGGSACWSQIDSAHGTATFSGTYGYGSTTLGNVTLYQKVTATGSYIKTYPEHFTSTRATRGVYLSSNDLFNLSSKCTAGCDQNPSKYDQVGPYTASSDVSVQWPSPGSRSRNSVAWVTVACEAAWSDVSSAYPGQWDMWVKSIKLQRQSSGAYYVKSDTTLPTSPDGGNFHLS